MKKHWAFLDWNLCSFYDNLLAGGTSWLLQKLEGGTALFTELCNTRFFGQVASAMLQEQARGEQV